MMGSGVGGAVDAAPERPAPERVLIPATIWVVDEANRGSSRSVPPQKR